MSLSKSKFPEKYLQNEFFAPSFGAEGKIINFPFTFEDLKS